MNIPSDLLYTNDHEWAKFDGDIVTSRNNRFCAR